MLRRKIMDNLIAWKGKNGKKALIVSGARQVGKTFIIREFGKEQYRSFIELNFIENPSLSRIFQDSLRADDILEGIRLYFPGVQIAEKQTLLFLDEIQDCPNAITALKFLAADERIDVIASGSALGMVYNRVTSYPVGSVEYLDMNSLDFEEFLWALQIGEESIQGLKKRCHEREVVPGAIHAQMMKYLKQYMVIGGMPEVVDTFVKSRDYLAADAIQRRIYRDYLADIARFASPDLKIKAENCYKSIPLQLSKENHKFQYSLVEKKGTSRKFESSLDWIVNAGMAIPVYNVKYIEYPLQAHRMEKSLRLYPNDIGLLICIYDYSLKAALLEENDLEGKPEHIILKTAKGGLYEALAADMLIKRGYKNLFFHRNESGTAEIEFLIENEDGVVPIEIKAGRAATKTLNRLLEKEDIKYGYKMSSGNVGVAGKKITLPLYMMMFL